MDGVHPYTRPEFWVKPENWYWDTEYYTPEAKEYFMLNVVRVAQREIDKRVKADFLPRQ
jgi:hypothetical protein